MKKQTYSPEPGLRPGATLHIPTFENILGIDFGNSLKLPWNDFLSAQPGKVWRLFVAWLTQSQEESSLDTTEANILLHT